jgi:alkyl hydroperoxide reductase subunit AhpC
MEGLKKIADDYAGRGVAVYWVSTESDSAKSKNFADDNQLRELGRKYKLTVLRDPDGAISKRLGADELPSTIIINKQGQVGAALNGLDPNADFAKQLASSLSKVLSD